MSTQKYKDGGVVDKSVLDVTDRLRNQKDGMTKTDVRDIERNFVVKYKV